MTRSHSTRRAFMAAALAIGISLFIRSIHTVGLARMADGLARVGWGFVIILALSGAREVVRTLAWVRSVEGPVRLGFARALRARLAGEAMNVLLPMGVVIGEPLKAVQVGPQLPFATAFTAIAVEFAFYTCSLLVLFGAGGIALIATEQIPARGSAIVLAAVPLAFAAGVAALTLVRTRAARPRGPKAARFFLHSLLRRAVAGAKRIEHALTGFAARHPDDVISIALLELTFHALGVAEVYATLWFVSPVPPTIATALVFETAGRVVIMAFKFLPMNVGVDETAAALVAARLNAGTAAGITLALVRKVRLLFWSAVGLTMLVHAPPSAATRRGWAAGFPQTGL